MRGANIDSDHYLVVAKVRTRITSVKKSVASACRKSAQTDEAIESRKFYEKIKRQTRGLKTLAVACRYQHGNLVTDIQRMLGL